MTALEGKMSHSNDYIRATEMSSLQFFKYQGTGNDFIMADNRQGKIDLSVEQIMHLCNRKFGIGSDGIILIEKSNDADFLMNFYNPNGSKSFCGNGSRCAVRFSQKLGIVSSTGSFFAIDGHHTFESNDDIVQIKMRDVNETISENNNFIIHTGSPHFIVYVDNLSELDVLTEGRKIRYSDRFKATGINVNFVEEKNGELYIRTYERGVEAETLSCGTGVTAAAISYNLRRPETSELRVITLGGELQVKWSRNEKDGFSNVYLSGPAIQVFEGSIPLSNL